MTHALACLCDLCKEAGEIHSRAVKDGRYTVHAFSHVMECFELASMRARSRDVSAQAIVKEIAGLAEYRFGSLRGVVFDMWGIRHSRDVGEIVRLLCDLEQLRPGKEDDWDDFERMDITFIEEGQWKCQT